MALKNLFKLEKLKIKAYKSRNRAVTDFIGTFEAMFNPTSLQQKYAIQYGKNQGLMTMGRQAVYTRNQPTDLRLKLLLDGTGVHEMGSLRLRQKKVSERVEEFLKLTFRMHGKTHEPSYLVVEWGDLIFSCRLGSVDISYTSFDRDGTALRAELDVTLLADVAVKKRIALENKSSPDVTHSRIVKSGDTLPLLSKEIYGDASYYLRLAQANNLDDFRNLQPGQEIVFPPLAP
jgi:nucleoid-associated protein YgaU